MSKSIQFSSSGYYPPLLPLSHNQMIPNPFQQNFRFLEQLGTPTSTLPTNIQVPTQIPVQKATQVAQSSLWRSPYPMLPLQYYPNVPPEQERPNPSNEMTYHSLKIEEIDPNTPGFSLATEQEIKNRISEGIPLIECYWYREGIQLFREAFLMDASSFIFSFFLAWQKIISKMKPQILERVEAILALKPKDPDALLLKGLCHIEPEKYRIAVKAVRSIVTNDPSDHFAKALLKEIILMHKRNMPVPVKNDQEKQASAPKRVAITALLNDEDTL